MVRFGARVEVGDQADEPLHLLDDLPIGVLGCPQSVPQPGCLKLYDAERSVQLMREVVYRPSAEFPLRFQGLGHLDQGCADTAQLIG